MTKNLEKKQERAVSQNEDSAWVLFVSMADLTWRMFTPSAILVPLGIWSDLRFHTKPWLTVLAAIAGLGLAVLLVRRQLGAIQ